MSDAATPGQPGDAGGNPSPAAAAVGGGQPATPGAEHPATVPWAGVEGTYKIGDGENAQPWWSGIEEEPIREYMETKNYANPYEAARAAWNANKMLNNPDGAVTLPTDKSTPEQWNEFYTKLGRPAEAAEYDFKLGDDIVEDPAMTEFGKGLLHTLGVPASKAPEAAAAWNEFVAKQSGAALEAQRAENEQRLTALEEKWEGAEQLNEMKAAGQRAVKALGLSNEQIQNIEANIGSADIVELLAMIGSKAPEGTFKDTGTPSGDPNDPMNMSAPQAQAAIDKLQGDEEFQKQYTDKNHPQHAEALKRMENLFKKANSK